jgi:hypothetical protein
MVSGILAVLMVGALAGSVDPGPGAGCYGAPCYPRYSGGYYGGCVGCGGYGAYNGCGGYRGYVGCGGYGSYGACGGYGGCGGYDGYGRYGWSGY